MQIHVWLQLVMLISGYLKLYPEETGLTVAFPQVSKELWKYGVIWDLLTVTLLCLSIYDVAFVMVYTYFGIFLGITMEPNRIYDSSVVQMLPALLLVRDNTHVHTFILKHSNSYYFTLHNSHLQCGTVRCA